MQLSAKNKEQLPESSDKRMPSNYILFKIRNFVVYLVQGTLCAMKPRAVLTKEQVIEIFRYTLVLSSSKKRPTASSVAKLFRVSEKTIRDIWTARTWHIETLQLDPNRRPRAVKKAGRPIGRKESMPRRTRFDKADAHQEAAAYSNCIGQKSDTKNLSSWNVQEEIAQTVDSCGSHEPSPRNIPFSVFATTPRGFYEYSESSHDPQKQDRNYALNDFQPNAPTECSQMIHQTTNLQLPPIQASLQLSPCGRLIDPQSFPAPSPNLLIARPDLLLPLLMGPQPASRSMPLLSRGPSHPPSAPLASMSMGLAAALLAMHPTLHAANLNAASTFAGIGAQNPAAIASPAFLPPPPPPPPPAAFAAAPPPPAARHPPPWP